jgi:hypothetical protein
MPNGVGIFVSHHHSPEGTSLRRAWSLTCRQLVRCGSQCCAAQIGHTAGQWPHPHTSEPGRQVFARTCLSLR